MDETKGCNVLVIDDEPEMGELIKLILGRGRNDEVKCAAGGCQGLIVAPKTHGSCVPPGYSSTETVRRWGSPIEEQ